MLSELIRYTEVADDLAINTFLKSGKQIPEAEALFSHILNAQHIWISRIHQVPANYERLDIHPVSHFREMHHLNIAGLKQILETEDLDKTVRYSSSFGTFEDNISHILFQVVNHSTYHRAQVASHFKKNGIQPPVTDFIWLQREGLL